MISMQPRSLLVQRVQTAGDRAQQTGKATATWLDEALRYWRVSDRHLRTLFIWRALTSPFWFASELPKPALPAWRSTTAHRMPKSPAGQWFDSRLKALEHAYGRSWLTAMVIRGIWLGLGLILLWVALALTGLVDLPSRWIMIGSPVLGGVAGFAFGWSIRPSAERIVGMLDRTFRLDERLTTATDTLIKGDKSDYVTQIQLADAANTLDSLAPDLPRPIAAPLRELWLLVVLVTALFTGLFAWVPNTGLPQAREAAVPAFVSAGERLTAQQEVPVPDQPTSSAPTVEEVQQQAEASNATRSDLGLLSDALRDHPSTSAASQAIDEGDYAGAADLLRSAAPDADSMSQEERNALADDLDEKADEISEENPELAASMHKAADDLRNGGEHAGDGLNEVADQLDQSGSKVVSQEELEQQLSEAESSGGGEESQSGQQSGEQQGGEQGQPGNQSDPGEGVDAQSGVVDEQGDPASSPNQAGNEGAQSGEAQAGAGSAPQEGDAPGEQTGEGSPGGNPSDQPSGESGSGGGETGESKQSGNDDQASQGPGAGGESGDLSNGQQDNTQADPSTGEGDQPQGEEPSEGEAVEEPPPSSGSGAEGGSGGSVRNNDGEQLPLEGASDENLPAGNQSGTSSSGSGGGQGTAGGDQAQGDVGVAGPDSNVVPEDMRDPVEDYFDGEGSQP